MRKEDTSGRAPSSNSAQLHISPNRRYASKVQTSNKFHLLQGLEIGYHVFIFSDQFFDLWNEIRYSEWLGHNIILH